MRWRDSQGVRVESFRLGFPDRLHCMTTSLDSKPADRKQPVLWPLFWKTLIAGGFGLGIVALL